MNWSPMTIPTHEKLTEWQETKREIPRVSQEVTDDEKTCLVHIDGLGAIQWGPERGRPLELDQVVVGLFENRKPLIAHIYFRPHTPATRAVNVGADAEVGKVIASVLEKRYASNSFKIEYYDPRHSNLDLQAMCLIIQESPFTKGTAYREETLQLVDEALGKLEA